MSVLSVLIYILKGTWQAPISNGPLMKFLGSSIRRCVSMRRIEEDEEFLEVFARILVGFQIPVCM